MNTIFANEIYKIFSTGVSEISEQFATTEYVDNEISNINVGSGGITQQDLDDAINPIIAYNTGQDLVITDINNNLANNFQTTSQLNSNFYNKTQVDDAIAVVDGKALTYFNAINGINTNLTNNYQTNTQLATNYYNKTETDANNWIDNTALAPYATTATLTANYQTNSQLATNYYNKGEVDTLVAGAGGGVSNPIELIDASTSIERYFGSTKFNTSLDLRTDQEAIRLVLGGASDGDTDTYVECNNNTGVAMIHKPLWLKAAKIKY